VPDLLDHLRATFRPDSEASYDEQLEQVRSVALLVLDDLGTESPTPWAREKLYQLVNHRYNERLPTVFTNNVRPEQLDPRIVSRMHDATLGEPMVVMRAGDYRRRR
jgi:DNA replication protein DnaC